MRLVRIQAERFRNLTEEPFMWADGMNLVMGANGEGKSNLLEAVTVLGTLRSFRGAPWTAVARHGEGGFRLSGEVEVGGMRRCLEQAVELGPPLRRTLRVDGREVESGEYLCCLPVFSLSSPDIALVAGPPELRRAFLDRLSFLLRPRHLAEVRGWQLALRQRNAALARRGDDDEMATWEEALSQRAASVVAGRLRTAARLGASFGRLYAELARPGFPRVELSYAAETAVAQGDDLPQLIEHYRSRLLASRARDRERGFTGEGPHRHDLRLVVGGRPARTVLSAGQLRLTAAALRLAALAEVEGERGETLPVTVDDADAELDDRALGRVLGILRGGRQVFLSTAHDRVAERVGPARKLWLRAGAVAGRGSDGDER